MTVKPRANITTPMLECSPSDISGMSSSTTTYSMAPAAKLSMYGINGTISLEATTVRKPNSGSTAPVSTPSQNDLHLDFHSALKGMEMIAPSGKF